jgi:hypothetical protein
MYVKEDLIIPHHYSFYDFIVTKVIWLHKAKIICTLNRVVVQARGKSGPLFSFDVHDDVRIVSDASVEKDESHAGKVLLRSWYERNKHIFPASRYFLRNIKCICRIINISQMIDGNRTTLRRLTKSTALKIKIKRLLDYIFT